MARHAIGQVEMEDILNGAAFFSSGGGGPRNMAQGMMQDILQRVPQLELLALESVDPNGLYAVAAYMGAPAAGLEKKTYDAPTHAVRRLEKELGEKLAGVVPVEIGAVSCFAPMTVAAQLGIPVVDCDGAGRAVPELTMLTYAAAGARIAPAVMATEHPKDTPGQAIVMDVADAEQAEELARPVVSSKTFGNVGGLALWAMRGKELQSCAIGGTISQAQKLGAALRRARETWQDPVQVVLDFLKGQSALLLRGRVTKIEQQTSGGFDVGLIELASDGAGPRMTICTQNESLIVWREDSAAPLLMSPDLICYVTLDGQGMSNAELVEGQELALIGVQARSEIKVPKIVGPFLELLHGIGYRGPYVPFAPSEEGTKPSGKKLKIRIIAPITDAQFNDGIKAEAASVAAPDMEIEVINLEHGPASIESRFAEALAAPGILARAMEAQKLGFDGVFVDCFGEPAVSMVREKVDIPVVGGFEPAALLACTVSRKFAIITVMPSVVPMIESLAKDLGVMDNITSVREVDIPVSELGDKDKLTHKLLQEALEAIRDEGAQAIVLGCTGMLDVAKRVETRLRELGKPAPVIDPTTAAITMLEALARNHLSQSRLTYFTPPPAR